MLYVTLEKQIFVNWNDSFYLVVVLFQACPSGYFGYNCHYECSVHCNVPGQCDKESGQCEGGCQSGWKIPNCDGCNINYITVKKFPWFFCHICPTVMEH